MAALGTFIEEWKEDNNWVNDIDITNMITVSDGKWGISLDMQPNKFVDIRYYCNEEDEPYIWKLRFDVSARFND